MLMLWACKYNNINNTLESLLSDPLGRVIIRMDNRRAKITVLNEVGRMGLSE